MENICLLAKKQWLMTNADLKIVEGVTWGELRQRTVNPSFSSDMMSVEQLGLLRGNQAVAFCARVGRRVTDQGPEDRRIIPNGELRFRLLCTKMK
jgi:hypothetical protein